jgi:hypothetical protein
MVLVNYTYSVQHNTGVFKFKLLPFLVCYVYRLVLAPSSGMSIQKSYKAIYNKNLRGPLFRVTIFHNVKNRI